MTDDHSKHTRSECGAAAISGVGGIRPCRNVVECPIYIIDLIFEWVELISDRSRDGCSQRGK